MTKIANNDKRVGAGRPSKRTFTARFAPKHAAITFSRKSASDLGIIAGSKFSLYESESNDLYISVCAASGATIKAGIAATNNDKNIPEYRVSDKGSVSKLLQRFEATKVVTLLVASIPTKIDDTMYYKVIPTPIRID